MGTQGIFFLVAGPSGSGKTTVLRQLLGTSTGLVKDVSVTTREPREGEQDLRDYHFWSNKKFEQGVADNEFIEYAVVHGERYYGTLKRLVSEQLDCGLDVIKDIDVQGVEQVRNRWPYPRSVAIFLLPPTRGDLERRLQDRGSDRGAELQSRLDTVGRELGRVSEYDYLVFNKTVEDAVADLVAIRRAEHLRRMRREEEFKQAWGKV